MVFVPPPRAGSALDQHDPRWAPLLASCHSTGLPNTRIRCDELALVAEEQLAGGAPRSTRAPHERWPSSPGHDMTDYLERLEPLNWPRRTLPAKMLARKACALYRRDGNPDSPPPRAVYQIAAGNHPNQRQGRPSSAMSAGEAAGKVRRPRSSGEGGQHPSALQDTKQSLEALWREQHPYACTRSEWLRKKAEQARRPKPVPVRKHDYSDDQKDPNYGFRKGEAARGRKSTPSFVLMFKPSSSKLGARLQGVYGREREEDREQR